MENKRKKEGHYLGLGIAIGMPIGFPFALLLGNIALAPAMGLPFGVVLGIILEKKYNPNPIKLTAKEKRNRKIVLGSTAVMGLVVLVIFVEFYLSLTS